MSRSIDFSSPDFSIPSVPRVPRFALERAENPYEVISKIFSCNHVGTRLVVRQISTGPRRAHQCLRCGTMTNNPISAEDKKRQFDDLPKFDESIGKRWNESRHAAMELAATIAAEKRQQKLDDQNRQWWDWYNQYTQSISWRVRRKKTLERDGYRCQACLENEATEVHHLTYAHAGCEPLFDLISVCNNCHEAITEMDRKRRGVNP